jgi:hypothetical protein
LDLLRYGYVFVTLLLLVCYFFSEVDRRHWLRAFNKITMASLFFLFGAVWFFRGGGNGWQLFALGGLLFSWLGDVLLLWSFVRGGISFSAACICFIAYESLLLRESSLPISALVWALVAVLLAAAAAAAFFRIKNPTMHKLEIPVKLYLLVSGAQGILGLCAAAHLRTPSAVLCGIGLALFAVSDYYLMTYHFVSHKKRILRLNSGTYFIGTMLIALSFSL